MTHQESDTASVRNPNDPWHREWGTGSVIATITAIVIMAGIVAYGASMGSKMPTAPHSTALHQGITGQSHAGS